LITITYDDEKTSLKRIIEQLRKKDMNPSGDPVFIE
jgi:hypothetical protein